MSSKVQEMTGTESSPEEYTQSAQKGLSTSVSLASTQSTQTLHDEARPPSATDMLPASLDDLDPPEARPESIEEATEPSTVGHFKDMHELREAAKGHKGNYVPQWSEKQFAEALKRANGVQIHAAKLLGCSNKTVTNALKRWPNLVQVKIDANALLVAGCRNVIVEKAIKEKDARCAMWLMERLQPEEWGRTRVEISGPNGQPINSVNAQVHVHLLPQQIKGLTDEQLEQLLDGDTRSLTLPSDPGGLGAGASEPAEDEDRPPAH